MSHIFDKVRIYTTRNHKQENYIPISPYGKNNEFRPIYLESKFPVCVVRHVCKIYEIIFRNRYMNNALVLQSTAVTINIGLREISEFSLALLNLYQVLTHQSAIF